MALGELVDVVTGGEMIPWCFQREHRKLHHVHAVDEVVEQLQLKTVHHILCVMHHDAGKAHIMLLLVQQHALHQPVQAVGLAGGPVIGHGDHAHIIVLGDGAAHGGLGGGVVLVDADEDAELDIFVTIDGVIHHLFDHLGLVPCRNDDGKGSFGRDIKLLHIERFMAAAYHEPAIEGAAPIEQVDEQVIEAGKNDEDRRAHQHAAYREDIMRNKIDEIHRRSSMGARIGALRPYSVVFGNGNL